MRITNIKVVQKTNLGNYESLEFGADAVIAEDDNIEESTQKVVCFVDWHAQKPMRDLKLRNYKAILSDENAPEDRKAEAQKWMEIYETRRAKVEAI